MSRDPTDSPLFGFLSALTRALAGNRPDDRRGVDRGPRRRAFGGFDGRPPPNPGDRASPRERDSSCCSRRAGRGVLRLPRSRGSR